MSDMFKKIMICVLALLVAAGYGVRAQSIAGSPEYIIALTAEWKGERFPAIEECWAELMKLGYQNQYEGDWMLVHETEDAVMVGRAVTAQFMPMRPDLENEIIEQGK